MHKHFFGGQLSPWQISHQHNSNPIIPHTYPQHHSLNTLNPHKSNKKPIQLTTEPPHNSTHYSKRRHTFYVSSTHRQSISIQKGKKTLDRISKIQIIADKNINRRKQSKGYTLLNFMKKRPKFFGKSPKKEKSTLQPISMNYSHCENAKNTTPCTNRIRSHSVFI